MKTVSGLGQQPRAESCGPGSSAYLCSVSPGASLGVSETEGLDKEMAGTASVVGLPGVGCSLASCRLVLPCPPEDNGTRGHFMYPDMYVRVARLWVYGNTFSGINLYFVWKGGNWEN